MNIEAANREAFRRLVAGQPVLVDVAPAHQVLPELDPGTVLHAGPPIQWDRMCGPLRGAILGALRYEGLAETLAQAERIVRDGKIAFSPCHHHQAVGPMTGIITRSMPLLVVENRAFGNRSFCTINEGLGKVLRFGANDEGVIARLRWLREGLAPALGEAVRASGGIDLRALMAQALTMGDEMHQRNVAATSLFVRAILPHLARLGTPGAALGAVADFLAGNDQFFLNLAMAAGKAVMDPVASIPASTMVTAMARNGTDFGIRVSGLPERWFTAPAPMPQGLYFPGYSAADANPDMGDSAIVETMGLGGFAMAASPPVAGFVGAGNFADARRITLEMAEITLGPNPNFPLSTLDGQGTPTGIDIRKVVETGILPIINTGVAHRGTQRHPPEADWGPGVGQVGAGIVRAPMACFEAALEAFASEVS